MKGSEKAGTQGTWGVALPFVAGRTSRDKMGEGGTTSFTKSVARGKQQGRGYAKKGLLANKRLGLTRRCEHQGAPRPLKKFLIGIEK